MDKVLVIGGGFAGLSSAVYLSDKHIKVTLLEAAPKLGGRAYSFTGASFGKPIDNGQHIMMGCYRHTLEYLRKIDASGNIEIQKKLRVILVEEGGKRHRLESRSDFYPINLLSAVMRFTALTMRERIGVLRTILSLRFASTGSLVKMSVREWLDNNSQSPRALEALWEILAVGTLNTSVDKASASTFASVLKQIFLTGNSSSLIVLPRTGLSEMYIDNSVEFIKQREGEIFLSEKAERIEFESDRIIRLKTNRRYLDDFDFVISSVPHHAFTGFFEERGSRFKIPDEISYSPILSVHLNLNENPFEERFYGLIGSDIHWVFNNGSHITLVKSDAADLINMKNDEIIVQFYSELEKYFPIFNRSLVNDFKVLKEKRATFIPSIRTEKEREKIGHSIPNLALAGDWTNTKLPSTIEGAVLSGKSAAQKALCYLDG